MTPLRRLLREYAWTHRWAYVKGTLFLIATNALTVGIARSIGHAIDALNEGRSMGHSLALVAGMGVAIMIVRTASRVYFFNPGRDIEYRLRNDVFEHLLALSPTFYAKQSTGDIVSRVTNDITFIRALIAFGALQIVNAAAALVMSGGAMASISPMLTVAALCPVVIGVVVAARSVRRLFDLQRESQEQLGAISAFVLETFQGIASVQGFVAEDAFERKLAVQNEAWTKTAMRLALSGVLASPVLGLAGGIAVFLVLSIGGPQAIDGQLSVGDIAALTGLLASLMPPLRILGFLFSVWQRGGAAVQRIFELLDARIERPEGEHPVVVKPGHPPEIEVRELTFRYPTGAADAPDALHGISFRARPGTTLGIFGKTGSGKTTLLAVLARLYDPPPGTVFVDGVDVRALDRVGWRDRVVLVPQRPFLFSETIRENIGLDHAGDVVEVAKVASEAALDADLAVLPQGIDTVVGERGVMLSGGQRQRVALARGLFRRADLLMLDDVLSAVDHETEARLVAALGRVGSGAQAPTTVIVSHRISAIRHADLVLVLDGGRLVDRGTPEELATRNGHFRDCWLLQNDEAAS